MAEKVVIGNAELWHGDCREVLPTLPAHDLLLTDPPYGTRGKDAESRHDAANGWRQYGVLEWDRERPAGWLFGLMREKGAECVVWGGNYFADVLPPSMRWLVWDKGQNGEPDVMAFERRLDFPTAMTGDDIYLTSTRYVVVKEA